MLRKERALGPTTASLVREARRRDITVWRIDDSSLIQLGTGRYQKRIRASCTGFTSQIATEIASDKDLTKVLLHDAGLPTPRGRLVRSAEEAVAAARELGSPMDLLFPSGARSRIPVIAITGTNGKSTTARMLSRILQSSGLRVGLTSTTGIYIDGERIMAGDCSGPKSARLVLREPCVDVAVLETARGGILREGLGFDQCDIGAVLNVTADHLGLKGIETVEDLAAVKSVVVESVAPRWLEHPLMPTTIRRRRWSGTPEGASATFPRATRAIGRNS